MKRTARRIAAKYPKLRSLAKPFVSTLNAKRTGKEQMRSQIAKEMSALMVEDPVIHVAEFSGEFRMSARSDLFKRVLINGSYEPELVHLIDRSIDFDRDVIDVGANIGFYTVMLAKRIAAERRVLAIEPTMNALIRLQSNIARNQVDLKVVVVHGVASDRSGEAELHVVPGLEEYSSIGAIVHPSIHDANSTAEAVHSFTLDELVVKYGLDPGFIKIDVEGGEKGVIEGAAATIATHRPIILAELSDSLLREQGTNAADVVSLLERFGYQVSDTDDEKIKPGSRPFSEVLCVPKSQ